MSNLNKWRHGQVVRHESAKLLSPGSNPGGASKKSIHVCVWIFYFLPIPYYFFIMILLNFLKVIGNK